MNTFIPDYSSKLLHRDILTQFKKFSWHDGFLCSNLVVFDT
jgi:hypothetical protein